MLHPGGFGGVGELFSLANLPVTSGLREGLDGEDAVSALQRAAEGASLLQIALDDVSTHLGQRAGGRLGHITGKRPDGEGRLFQ